MKVIETPINDLLIIEPKVFGDSRGYFQETYSLQRYSELGIPPFVQDNHSYSQRGVLRGLHFQKQKPQGKLVFVTDGEVLDVAVDLRANSETFGHCYSLILSGDNHRQFWVPPGFAHGFCVLSETAHFQYKCTQYYDVADEGGIHWRDPDLAVDWPEDVEFSLSNKDQNLGSFQEYKKSLGL
ncbi:MAG TPA: dTDP-4-dehydrorhamnose 3,5-epimerase [Gammaproteobacteria bacterium]|nr:dTDP-4-dehydrorhamnose 3,5-epimerase [Gammaproteobacteria bacterium]